MQFSTLDSYDESDSTSLSLLRDHQNTNRNPSHQHIILLPMLTQSEDVIRKWCLKHGESGGQGEDKVGSRREDCYKEAVCNENMYSRTNVVFTIQCILLTLNAHFKS